MQKDDSCKVLLHRTNSWHTYWNASLTLVPPHSALLSYLQPLSSTYHTRILFQSISPLVFSSWAHTTSEFHLVFYQHLFIPKFCHSLNSNPHLRKSIFACSFIVTDMFEHHKIMWITPVLQTIVAIPIGSHFFSFITFLKAVLISVFQNCHYCSTLAESSSQIFTLIVPPLIVTPSIIHTHRHRHLIFICHYCPRFS